MSETLLHTRPTACADGAGANGQEIDMPTITLSDRIAALEIASRAEQEALDRAERSGNSIAAKINRLRRERAEKSLFDARLAGGDG